jgi:hypothetical protein
MTTTDGLAASFTPVERDYIRRELDQLFSTFPSVAEGFQLRTWRGGPQRANQSCHRQPRRSLTAASCVLIGRRTFLDCSSRMRGWSPCDG